MTDIRNPRPGITLGRGCFFAFAADDLVRGLAAALLFFLGEEPLNFRR